MRSRFMTGLMNLDDLEFYPKTDKSAFIDTEIKYQEDIEVKFRIKVYSGNSTSMIMGARDGTGSNPLCVWLIVSGSTPKLRFDISSTGTLSYDIKYDTPYSVTITSDKIIINNEINNISHGSNITSKTIRLFSINMDSEDERGSFLGEWSYFKISSGNSNLLVLPYNDERVYNKIGGYYIDWVRSETPNTTLLIREYYSGGTSILRDPVKKFQTYVATVSGYDNGFKREGDGDIANIYIGPSITGGKIYSGSWTLELQVYFNSSSKSGQYIDGLLGIKIDFGTGYYIYIYLDHYIDTYTNENKIRLRTDRSGELISTSTLISDASSGYTGKYLNLSLVNDYSNNKFRIYFIDKLVYTSSNRFNIDVISFLNNSYLNIDSDSEGDELIYDEYVSIRNIKFSKSVKYTGNTFNMTLPLVDD